MTNVRLHIVVRGAVQGVGFRPFVYRLAHDFGLTGWVSNTAQGVFIEVEGARELLEAFLLRLQDEKPSLASIQSLEYAFLDPVGFSSFEIRASAANGARTAIVLPDIATCDDCLRELFDPNDRRYLYPFTNCTNCGPRFSIIEALPYDRANTSMKKFVMCPDCRREYEDPANRRFHAQPNACPACGPHLELWDPTGIVLAEHHLAARQAADGIRRGQVVAVKGLGGFHLIVDARNEEAVSRLRSRKHREEKPLALMFPSVEEVKEACSVEPLEERLLESPESPIVLLRRKDRPELDPVRPIARAVAPNNPYLGVMLPYTPLHHILMRELKFPVVATSGNISDEPICTDEREALDRLRGVADLFLVHDRPIVRHVDDSVARVMLGREQVLRRARGYAPLPVHSGAYSRSNAIAVGAHLKNSVAVTCGQNVVLSQHIGDLDTSQSFEAFRKVLTDLPRLHDVQTQRVVCDLHPDYISSKHAKTLGKPVVEVQHHYAHVAACMAENELAGTVLGVSWDGTGYGLDGTIWGGEFLRTTPGSFERVATIRSFRLPGGEQAIKEPRRTALGLLFELFGTKAFEKTQLAPVSALKPGEREAFRQMLAKGIRSPLTSSVGRLFDGVASIIGIRQEVNFEGQAAMELEFLATAEKTDASYEFGLEQRGEMLVIDWGDLILGVLDDLQEGKSGGIISAKFHNTLSRIIVGTARRVGKYRVLLTGGCFQNRYLTEQTVRELERAGFKPYWHQRVPPNDGGIAAGQLFALMRVDLDSNQHSIPSLEEEKST